MKKHAMPEIKEGGVNVTPLIDIVMCLIIFYMLVARIGVNRGTVNYDLPGAPIGAKIDDQSNLVNLNVERMMNDTRIVVMDPTANNTMRSFTSGPGGNIQHLGAFLRRLKGNREQFKAVIRANKDLDYRFIQPALIAIGSSSITEYAFEARDEKVH